MTDISTEETRKKRRLQNSCDECRRRKGRCDSTVMPGGICSSCISMKVHCTHLATRKKRGPKTGAPSHTTVKAMISAILSDSPATFIIPEDQDSIRKVLVELAKYARHLEKELNRARRQKDLTDSFAPSSMVDNAGSGPSPQSADDDSDYSETEAITEQISNLSLSRLQNRHFGRSSGLVFIASMFDLKRYPDLNKRIEFWTPSKFELERTHEQEQLPSLEFPEDDHLRALLDIYFTSHHPYFPLLHRSTFERSVGEGLHHRDHQFGSLLLALCSVASRFSDDPRSLPKGSSSTLALGWRWFRQLKLTRDTFAEPISLYELQTYCLAIFFLQSTYLSDSAWILLGLSIRLAHERGIHRRRDPEEKLTLERELWKRVFWILLANEIIMSSFLGRPRAITSDDYDIEPLIECDEKEWENPDVDISTMKTSEQSYGVFWNCFMCLLEIVSFCHHALYSVRRSESTGVSDSQWNDRTVREVDSALNSWLDTVPGYLKWDPHIKNDIHLAQSTLLYSYYYWTQIQTRRSFIQKPANPGSEEPLNFPLVAVCINAARSCVHVIDALYRRNCLPTITLLPPLFNSCVVILLSIFRAQELKLQIDSQKEMVNVNKCLEILREWEKRKKVAGRFVDVINAMMNDLKSSHEVEETTDARMPQSLKRGRELEYSSNMDSTRTAETSVQAEATSHCAVANVNHNPGPQSSNYMPSSSGLIVGNHVIPPDQSIEGTFLSPAVRVPDLIGNQAPVYQDLSQYQSDSQSLDLNLNVDVAGYDFLGLGLGAPGQGLSSCWDTIATEVDASLEDPGHATNQGFSTAFSYSGGGTSLIDSEQIIPETRRPQADCWQEVSSSMDDAISTGNQQDRDWDIFMDSLDQLFGWGHLGHESFYE